MNKIQFKNLEDVRAWKALKKEELELQKVTLKVGRSSFKRDLMKSLTQFVLFEVALILGQKTLSSLLKTLLRSASKAMKKPDEEPLNSETSD